MVKTMKGLWSGISGSIIDNEVPLKRAKIEIFEEVGVYPNSITLLKSLNSITVKSKEYHNQEWIVFPFLFKMIKPLQIKLNWENSEYKWISSNEITSFDIVPDLGMILEKLII